MMGVEMEDFRLVVMEEVAEGGRVEEDSQAVVMAEVGRRGKHYPCN